MGHSSAFEGILVVKLLISLVALLCAFANANAKALHGWKTYSGAYFVVFYPESFIPVPIQKSRDGFDSVAFVAPSHDVEFYVFSPLWGGRASALDIDAHRERITSKKVVVSGGAHATGNNLAPGTKEVGTKFHWGPHGIWATDETKASERAPEKGVITDTWLGISAIDGSYVRFVHEQRNDFTHTALAFGIKCKDMKTYARYKTDYNRFRKSLVQYGDGLAE